MRKSVGLQREQAFCMIYANTSKNTSFRWELRDRRKVTELLELPITPGPVFTSQGTV